MNFRQRHFGATSWPLYADASFTWASYPISAHTFGVTVCACFHPQLWGEKLPSWESFNWGSMSKLLFDQCKLCCSAVKVEFCWMNIINLVWVSKPHDLHEVNFSFCCNMGSTGSGRHKQQDTLFVKCMALGKSWRRAGSRISVVLVHPSAELPPRHTAGMASALGEHGFPSESHLWFDRHFQDWN